MKCCQTFRQILKPSLGATKADVTKATERNEMSGGNGNIEFLVEWDGDWADTWNRSCVGQTRQVHSTYGDSVEPRVEHLFRLLISPNFSSLRISPMDFTLLQNN